MAVKRAAVMLCSLAKRVSALTGSSPVSKTSAKVRAPVVSSRIFERMSVSGKSDGAQQGELGAARVEPGVLHDDRHVGLDDARVVGVARHGRGIVEVVEAHM